MFAASRGTCSFVATRQVVIHHARPQVTHRLGTNGVLCGTVTVHVKYTALIQDFPRLCDVALDTCHLAMKFESMSHNDQSPSSLMHLFGSSTLLTRMAWSGSCPFFGGHVQGTPRPWLSAQGGH